MKTVRIVGEMMQVLDTSRGGAVVQGINLPPGNYSNIIVSGDECSVQIDTYYGTTHIRTVNLVSGGVICDNQI